MPEVNINGILVNFPFEPYKVQYDYMKKVLECLKKGENGILESPTGTGKTLSLLCSSLAWLLVKKAQLQASSQGLNTYETPDGDFVHALRGNLEKSAGKENFTWSNILGNPKIIYASRTHSQLSQAVNELKRTNYKHVKVAILGSRDQLCIHPEVMKESTSSAKIFGCQIRVAAHSCHYFNTLENKKSDSSFFEEIMDIEDLTKRSKNMQCCPYYLARELQKTADIIFIPYNYLFDAKIRKTLDLELTNSVIILDEGHNIEKMCEESASMELSSTDIALCISEVTQVMHNVYDELKTAGEGSEEQLKDFAMDDLCLLKTLFLELEKIVNEIPLKSNNGQKVGKEFMGSYVFELLAKAEINDDKWPPISELLFKVAQHLQTTSDSALGRKGNGLQKFSDFLHIIFSSKGITRDVTKTDGSYKVYIEPEVKKNNPNAWSTTKTPANNSAKVINFWCFSPGFGMRTLLEQGVHSIIITSGTLSPLDATIQELGIPINVQLENPHIIKPQQICVTIVKEGPGEEQLKSTYLNRERPEYLRDLGQTLLNFSRKIPDGLLVFFPSYHVLNVSMNFWQQSGHWTKIAEIKPIFVEPKEKGQFNNIMSEYYDAIRDGHSRGAILLGVCRGKISEGVDFADAKGRGVMVTGLPYPPFYSPRVMLKQKYLDENWSQKKGLTGKQWYELEAVRAVNQAIGRVIRHADDYGTVLLCDSRFDNPKTINTLSSWLRPYINRCKSFGLAYGKVIAFFRNVGDQMPLAGSSVEGASFGYAMDVKSRPSEPKKENEENKNKERSSNFKAFLEQMKSEVQPSEKPSTSGVHGLLDALNTSNKPKMVYNPLKATAEEQSPFEEKVEPEVKRRKLRIVPLKFESSDASTSTEDSNGRLPPQKIEEYVLEVKRTVEKSKYELFKSTVKGYTGTGDYTLLVSSLSQVFTTKESQHLLSGFQRFIKPKDKSRFEAFCNTVFKN